MEEKIYQRQIAKQGLSVAVDGSNTEGTGRSEFSLQELRDLFTLRLNTRCDTHDLLQCPCFKASTDPLPHPSGGGLGAGPKKEAIFELMTWRHTSGVTATDDPILQGLAPDARDAITAIFTKETLPYVPCLFGR